MRVYTDIRLIGLCILKHLLELFVLKSNKITKTTIILRVLSQIYMMIIKTHSKIKNNVVNCFYSVINN